MSAENEKKHSESDAEPKVLQDSLRSASPILIKILELIIGLLCICLIFVPFDNNLQRSIHRSGVVCVAFSLPVLVNTIIIFSHFQRSPTPKLTLYCFSFTAGVLLFAAGSILITDWWAFSRSLHFHPPKMFMDLMLSSGIFAFVNSIISFVDLGLTYKYY